MWKYISVCHYTIYFWRCKPMISVYRSIKFVSIKTRWSYPLFFFTFSQFLTKHESELTIHCPLIDWLLDRWSSKTNKYQRLKAMVQKVTHNNFLGSMRMSFWLTVLWRASKLIWKHQRHQLQGVKRDECACLKTALISKQVSVKCEAAKVWWSNMRKFSANQNTIKPNALNYVV